MTAVLSAERKLRKWGGGLGLNIPKALAETLELESGDNVTFKVLNADTFTVEVKREPKRKLDIPKYTFADLVSEDDQPLGELDWGAPVGNERI